MTLDWDLERKERFESLGLLRPLHFPSKAVRTAPLEISLSYAANPSALTSDKCCRLSRIVQADHIPVKAAMMVVVALTVPVPCRSANPTFLVGFLSGE